MARKRGKRLLIALLCLALAVPAGFGIYRLIDYLTTTSGDYRFVVLQDGTAEIRNYRGRATKLELPSVLKEHPVTRVGAKAFNWRFYVTDVAIPRGVTAIDEGAFAGCHALTGLTLPGTLEAIGESAFSGCRKLAKVALPDGLATLGGRAFDQCASLTDIAIPASVADIPANPFTRCDHLTGLTVADGHPSLSVEDGMLYDTANSRLICCPAAMIGRIRVPGSVSMILPYAFCNSGMTDVFLPDTVLDISSIAFRQDYEDLTDESTGKSTRTYYYSFTIHCSHGSIAEQYAIRRQIPYVLERQ